MANEKKNDKNWVDTLEKATDKFKDVVGYDELKNGNKPNANEIKKGEKTKILGLDPFVALAISFTLIISSAIAIVVISRKQKKL